MASSSGASESAEASQSGAKNGGGEAGEKVDGEEQLDEEVSIFSAVVRIGWLMLVRSKVCGRGAKGIGCRIELEATWGLVVLVEVVLVVTAFDRGFVSV